MSASIDVAKYFEPKAPLSELQHTQPYNLASVVQHSWDTKEPTYLMHLDARAHDQQWKVAVACSDNQAKLYDYSSQSGTLSFTHALKHRDNINDIQFALRSTELVCTACEDGSAQLWDVRSGKSEKSFKVPKGSSSCTLTDGVLAASGEEGVYIWDIRKEGQAKTVVSGFHTSDILRVRWHPTQPNRLFSASDDGTILQYDLTVEDLDEALLTSMSNVQPVAKFGFFGPQSEYLYAISTVETLSLWDCAKGRRLAAFPDIRQQLSHAAKVNIDCLINCHYDPAQERLFLTAGSFEGALLLNHVNTRDIQPLCLMMPADGHSGVIRDSLLLDQTVITGGQDSKICVWSQKPLVAPPSAKHTAPSPAAAPQERQNRKFAPY